LKPGDVSGQSSPAFKDAPKIAFTDASVSADPLKKEDSVKKKGFSHANSPRNKGPKNDPMS
jgi:hypothetical protein